MKLREIYKLTLNRIGEREGDRQIENIVMAGINTAYKLIAVNNKKSRSVKVEAEANTPVKLPEDFISLVMLLKEGSGGGILAKNEYYIDADLLLVTNPDLLGDLNMIYNFVPVELTLEKDGDKEPVVLQAYHSALSSYGAYYYYNFKNNMEASTQCLNEFNNILGFSDKTYTLKDTQLKDIQPNK